MNAYPLYLRRAMLRAGVPESKLLPPPLTGESPGWALLRAEAKAEVAKARATLRSQAMIRDRQK